MLRLLHSRSPVFRTLLVLALLAWTALPFDAYAHALAMAVDTEAGAPMAMGTGSASHCPGMSRAGAPQIPHAAHPAPSHDGQGCCTGHNCHCASLSGGIAGAPYFRPTFQPTHGPVRVPVRLARALTHAAPPLRPPIR